MGPIKKYNNVDESNASVHFRISRTEDYYVARQGQPDEPHRHDYYTIVFIKKGKGKHFVDFEEYELKDNQIYFIDPGQVHQVVEEEQSFGFSIVFSEQFLIENYITPTFLLQLNLFNSPISFPLLSISDTEKEKFSLDCEKLITLMDKKDGIEKHLLGAYFRQFLIECAILLSNLIEVKTTEHNNSLFHNFRDLVEQNYNIWHSVKEYSNSLHITPDHLNRTVKAHIGKTTKEYIHSRILLAAKRKLYFTEFTSKEIAYQIGFSEPSHFSTFFKKNSGLSPRAFKELYKK